MLGVLDEFPPRHQAWVKAVGWEEVKSVQATGEASVAGVAGGDGEARTSVGIGVGRVGRG